LATQTIVFNTSWWFYGSKEKFDAADKTNLIKLQTGVYYEQFGKSNQEIAALSRSRHQSQGFGSTGTRGEEEEYLEFLKGDALTDKTNLFEGIDTTWNRVKNGKPIGEILANVQKNFDFKNPSASVPELIKAYELIQQLNDTHWKTIKSEEIKKIIAACAGMYLEAVTDNQEATSKSSLKVKLEAINRSDLKINWNSISTTPSTMTTQVVKPLENNKPVNQTIELDLSSIANYTQPYYLKEKGTVGMYRVDDQENIGKPDILREVKVVFSIEINGVVIPFERNVVYKYNDDVKGEVYQPLDVVPLVTSSIQEKVYIFPNNKEKSISIKIKAGKENVSGSIELKVPSNWKVTPPSIPFSLKIKVRNKWLFSL